MKAYIIDNWETGIIETVDVRSIDADGVLSARSETRGEIQVDYLAWFKSPEEARRVAGATREATIDRVSKTLDALRRLTFRLDTDDCCQTG